MLGVMAKKDEDQVSAAWLVFGLPAMAGREGRDHARRRVKGGLSIYAQTRGTRWTLPYCQLAVGAGWKGGAIG